MTEIAPWDANEADGWASFLEGTAERPPLPFFERAMEFVDGADGGDRLAIDLGCGGGADTLGLLERGWRVHAVDASPTTERLINDRLDAERNARVTIDIGLFHEVDLPEADLVYAQMSLPFAGSDLQAAASKAAAAVLPGGAFAGHFFGEEDDWIDGDNVAAVNGAWIRTLFNEFSDLTIDEVNQDGPYGLEGRTKQWHYYFVLARR